MPKHQIGNAQIKCLVSAIGVYLQQRIVIGGPQYFQISKVRTFLDTRKNWIAAIPPFSGMVGTDWFRSKYHMRNLVLEKVPQYPIGFRKLFGRRKARRLKEWRADDAIFLLGERQAEACRSPKSPPPNSRASNFNLRQVQTKIWKRKSGLLKQGNYHRKERPI